MHRYINQLRSNIDKLENIIAKYPTLFEGDNNFHYIDLPHYSPNIDLHFHDAALCGDVLGKTGWTRVVYSGGINWTKTVDDVNIIITNAESIPALPKDVPPSAFPLQLREANDPDSQI